jgi:dihydroorotate dehydrogenase
VRRRRFKGILGINIGKNFDTPIEQAADDYLLCLDKVYPHADYITVNISSPNTAKLRELQGETQLDELLGAISQRRAQLSDEWGRCVPLAVKIAPDLEDDAIPLIAAIVAQHRMDAVIAANTTVGREGVQGLQHADEAGGLSGAPLKPRADRVLGLMRDALPEEIALIGVGGITCGQDAVDKLELGADVVQFYTGMVYRGPELVAECLQAIAAHNER